MNFEKGKIIGVIKDYENEKKRSKKKENKNYLLMIKQIIQ